ncbi:MAG: histidine triad nucleotide-binding protein [Ignavibacteria bacterium]|nr:histidine triad nucleotide-binding protein [Ignavibacteria bacterium]
MAETIFSKIVDKSIPANIVFEDEYLLAFTDVNPQAPVHILIIPKKPIESLNLIEEDDSTLIGKMVLAAKRLACDFGISESGYRLVFNCNRDGGQTVFHLHCHLLGGRNFSWPPG